jgi:adenine-specific DNA-methyltransferase
MNTLNYIGSKHTLCNKILDIFQKNIPDCREKSFLDLFAGTGTIGFHCLPLFRTVSANDWEYYSYVINRALLIVPYTEVIASKIEECNALEEEEGGGLIYKELAAPHTQDGMNTVCRMFFTTNNAKKADAIRLYLNREKMDKKIDENEYIFLLASLLTSIDKVANTTSVYGSFLKTFKASALKPLILEPIHTRKQIPNQENRVFNEKAEDVFHTFKEKVIHYDVVYLDPPYNQRQYAANYSPLNFIAEYNPDKVLKGKTGLLEGYNKSDFCSKTKAKTAFQNLFASINATYLFLSYNNEGILDINTLKTILLEKGDVTLYTIPYKKYKSQTEAHDQQVQEYIWFIDTTKKTDTFEQCVL